MLNEVIFFLQLIVSLIVVTFAFRMGKNWVYTVIAVYVVLANIFVTKQMTLFGLAATGGNVLYGCTFFATDLLSEHFSKAEARRGVMIGFFAAVIFLIMTQFILLYKPSAEDFVSEGMKSIFTMTPRIILASMTAYLISQMHDVWAFHFWRGKTKDKYLWLRNNFSTWVSQIIDSIIFTLIAFYGVFSGGIILQIIISTYILKIMVAIIDTPFIYFSYRMIPNERKKQ